MMIETIGERIVRIRKSKGISQIQLAKKCGLIYQTLSKYERNILNPKLETIKKIASALEIDYLELLDTKVITESLNKPLEGYLYQDWVMFYSGIYETFLENEDLFYKWYKKTLRRIDNYIQDLNNINLKFDIPFYEYDNSHEFNIDYCKQELEETKKDLEIFKDTLENMFGDLTEKDFFDTTEKKRNLFIIIPDEFNHMIHEFYEPLLSDKDYKYSDREQISNDYYNSLSDKQIEILFNKLVDKLKLENEKFKKAIGVIE